MMLMAMTTVVTLPVPVRVLGSPEVPADRRVLRLGSPDLPVRLALPVAVLAMLLAVAAKFLFGVPLLELPVTLDRPQAAPDSVVKDSSPPLAPRQSRRRRRRCQ